MRNLSTHELIKAVPLNDVLRQELLTSFDSYDDAKKYDILTILWDAFSDMKLLLKAIMEEKIMQDMTDGALPMDTNVAEETDKKLWNYIDDLIAGKQEENEKLDKIRSQLSHLINEKKEN